jgi:hypothetical protein
LNAAASGLAEASKLLADSLNFNSNAMIEVYLGMFRVAKAKFSGALEAYFAHVTDPSVGRDIDQGHRDLTAAFERLTRGSWKCPKI